MSGFLFLLPALDRLFASSIDAYTCLLELFEFADLKVGEAAMSSAVTSSNEIAVVRDMGLTSCFRERDLSRALLFPALGVQKDMLANEIQSNKQYR